MKKLFIIIAVSLFSLKGISQTRYVCSLYTRDIYNELTKKYEEDVPIKEANNLVTLYKDKITINKLEFFIVGEPKPIKEKTYIGLKYELMDDEGNDCDVLLTKSTTSDDIIIFLFIGDFRIALYSEKTININ